MQSVVIEQTRASLSFDSDKYRELMDGRKVEFHFHSNIKFFQIYSQFPTGYNIVVLMTVRVLTVVSYR